MEKLEVVELNDLYLFSKHHYGSSKDLLSDLKVIHSVLFAVDAEYVTTRDIASVLSSLVYKHLTTEFQFTSFLSDIHPENTWKVGYRHNGTHLLQDASKLPPYDYNLALIYSALSVISLTRCFVKEQQILNIGTINPIIKQKLDEARKIK